jgi:hypothetical protein
MIGYKKNIGSEPEVQDTFSLRPTTIIASISMWERAMYSTTCQCSRYEVDLNVSIT